MRSHLRNLVIGTMTALLLAGSAVAVGPDVSAEALVDGDHRYVDGDASAATDAASGALDGDASLSAPSTDGVWGWFELRMDAALSKLGVDESADAEAYVSDDGVDLDADAAGKSFDGSPAGDADGLTWTLLAKVKSFFGGLF